MRSSIKALSTYRSDPSSSIQRSLQHILQSEIGEEIPWLVSAEIRAPRGREQEREGGKRSKGEKAVS
jgi:hypothetical protein